ncbi:energy transducer TonB [Chromohalobacter israelensis]|uniref:energy transducer TonB n=1 Tax=Chromohalobacter israelensis TaxID=141390 RepID=UPI00055695C9|nr:MULTISPECIES: energy transducer TonB [Chromohalobacter]MBZ5876713.1 energy transducer TonB [Chromohalobacter salexigens]MDF9434835.1 energy transducer TonB [Chromohalobacter israelensis]MDO0945054.1 energy transducer TonB [Chromohalobacter salexigens]
MRAIAGAAGGVLMALGLFYLLALLVAPPDDAREPIEQPMSVSRVEAPQAQAPAPQAAAPDAPTPPADTPPPPPPSPVPAAQSDSALALPEPERSAPPTPEVPQETLPELEEIEPQPEPTPEPQPEPEPAPEPEPTPQPTESSSANEASQGESEAASADQAADSGESSQAPSQEVGSPQPTERVPPEYPSRAQRRGIEGYVEVRFTIQPDGRVDADSLRVTEAQPRNVFERAALKAISGWRFPRADAPREARQRLEFRLKR